ncbi:MAG: hypothetical protein V7L26_14245 [Nostoc sp.]|uniref:DUF6887 family protein n=1 Tax=Nostoc sp. TaxID=1180 RepID=UPI002FEF23EF
MTPDYESMSKEELRAYVLINRDNQEAFYAYMDKLRESSRVKCDSEEQFTELVQQKLVDGRENRAKRALAMNVRQAIIDEVESCPDHALLEVLNYLRVLKARINKFGS